MDIDKDIENDRAMQFVGAWHLKSWTITDSTRDKISHPFGLAPIGLITYSDDGWMSATVSSEQRDSFSSGDRLRSQPDNRLAEAYKSYFSYTGSYELNEDEITHWVTMSLNPNMVGTKQVRKFKFVENQLHLSGIEKNELNTRTHSLIWQR